MSNVYEKIAKGFTEVIEDAKVEKKILQRPTVTIVPVKLYSASDIQRIQNRIGMSRSVFVSYMGVSLKTVEAWDAGTNHPSGVASRILSMMEMDVDLTGKYPFVQSK